LSGRDLAIVAAVVLLGGFALADTLRSRGEEPSAQTTQIDRNGPEPQPEAPEDWPAGRIRGTLVFTDAEQCRVRVIGLGGGRERPTGELVGVCDLWAAPIGQRIAYGTGGVRGGAAQSFAVVDLRRASVDLGTFQNLGGDVLWSPDAQRLAWCTENGVGQEFEVGSERPRSSPRCPIAYTPDGRLAFAIGGRLVVDGRTVVRERYPIVYAHWGTDESLLVVLAGGFVRRYAGGGSLVGVYEIRLFTDLGVIPSPDNCAVLYSEPGRIHVADVGCAGLQARSFIGFAAAWSPDGQWVAVADPVQIEFHNLLTEDEILVWPARARDLYWRGD
jgi:WD40-like Beta Propeller Repeat